MITIKFARLFRLLLILYIFSITHLVRAEVYQDLAVNLIPTDQVLQFCLTHDAKNRKADEHLYLAAMAYGQWYYLSHAGEGSENFNLSLEPLPFATNPPLKNPNFCLSPLPKTSLQDISVYAGVGTSLEEVLQTQKFSKIFDGMTSLPRPQKEWTVMVYMIGSNFETNPQRLASQDVIEMLKGSQDNHNTHLVLTTGGSKREGWKTVKRVMIHQGQYEVIADLGEKSMAAPETLSEFVPWAVTHFPAQHYALILWDHGKGTLGYGADISDAGRAANQGKLDEMTLTELHQAFQSIRSHLTQPLDIVSYDACHMATIEIAEITSNLASAMSASVEKEPDHGADYHYLLTHLATAPPSQGLEFGKLLKAAYLHQAQQKRSETIEETTWETDQITYSVFDLAQLPLFRDTFKNFAQELERVLQYTDFLDPDSSYKMLSNGMIHAPIYPAKPTETMRSKRFTQGITEQDVHIDLYTVLQTVLPEFPDLKSYADQLLKQLNEMVIEYEANANVKKIHADAGRLSMNVGTSLPYLQALPEAYQLFHKALGTYNQRKSNDLYNVNEDSQKTCYGHHTEGMMCAAFPNWLHLPAEEVLKVELYLGQYTEATNHIYLIKSLYQRQGEVTQSIELGTDGNQACRQQLCVNKTDCANITVTEQNDQRFADILLNQSPAILTFCQNKEKQWRACSVVSQTDGLWGRSTPLYPDDNIAPITLHWSTAEEMLEEKIETPLTVEAQSVTLTQHCDPDQSAIVTSSYGANLQPAYRELCREESCICTKEDFAEPGDDACKKGGTKAGVYIDP